MKKLIKDKQQFLNDMLEGIKIAHPELEVINDTVVVKKDKKTTKSNYRPPNQPNSKLKAYCRLRQPT